MREEVKCYFMDFFLRGSPPPPFTDKIFGKEGIYLGNFTKYEPIQYMNLWNLVYFKGFFTLWAPTL